MLNSDYKNIFKLYSEVNESELLTESFAEGTTVLPTIIKVKEFYEGGPHAGETDIVYRVIARMGTVIKGVCQNNPDLTCEIDIEDPTVTEKDGTYVTTARFKWDDHRKTYQETEVVAPAIAANVPAAV